VPTQQWNGTTRELERLCAAIERNCACDEPVLQARPTCAAHALLSRQTTLDHLLFVYRTRQQFISQECSRD
jgi:hypothetical protein